MKHLDDSWVQFPSARGFSFYKNLAEVAHKITGRAELLDSDEELLRKLAEQVGPYYLADSAVYTLKAQGARVAANSRLPFAAPCDYLDFSLIRAAAKEARLWTVPEIQHYFTAQKLKLTAWRANEDSEKIFQSNSRCRDLDLWAQVEVLDALECHRNPYLILRAE